jgi:DNA-nicking Smr family endonuclease
MANEVQTLHPFTGLDRRTSERLRKGKLPIEARLDLHGLRQHEARTALIRFIQRSAQSHYRCVLVITGKGRTTVSDGPGQTEAGILRRSLPLWLTDPAIAGLVLHHAPAQPRDGGTGATYILLRRSRL